GGSQFLFDGAHGGSPGRGFYATEGTGHRGQGTDGYPGVRTTPAFSKTTTCPPCPVSCPLSLPCAPEARRRPRHRGGSACLRPLLLLLPRQLLDALPGEGDLRRGVARGRDPVVELLRRR